MEEKLEEKLTGNFEQFPKMAKKTLTGPGLEPETSGLTYQRLAPPPRQRLVDYLGPPPSKGWIAQVVRALVR